MKNENKKSWAHAYVCVLCQHHNRTTTSLSVGRSVGRYMYVSTVCFFVLARSAAKLYYFLHTVRTR